MSTGFQQTGSQLKATDSKTANCSRISTGHLRKAIIESPPTTVEGILGALSRKWGGTSSGGLEHQEKQCGGTGWPKGKDMDKEAGSMVGRGLAEEKQGRERWKRNANRRT